MKTVFEFLENVFLWVIAAVGFAVGFFWRIVYVTYLAFADGFRRGFGIVRSDAVAQLPRSHQGEPGPGNTYVYSERGLYRTLDREMSSR